jgi:hypothetical protein
MPAGSVLLPHAESVAINVNGALRARQILPGRPARTANDVLADPGEDARKRPMATACELGVRFCGIGLQGSKIALNPGNRTKPRRMTRVTHL